MGNLCVLDVTLRDGGCVNDFNFGQTYMEKILEAEEEAGIDIIELGYLDKNNGSEKERTKFIDEKSIYKHFLKKKRSSVSYVAMMDYGKFNPNELEERNAKGLDGIRLAFHKKDYLDAIEKGKIIISKGYDLYMQPMITLKYSDRELIDLIERVNEELGCVKAFYIVDSFGEMRSNDLVRIWNIVNHNLSSDMIIGFHSHNNLQLSYSNAMEFLALSNGRNVILDSSIMGMGKGAGNLNTELILEYLNLSRDTNYKIAPLLNVIDKVINQLYAEWRWGYSPEYYLSAINHCTPTYASYFYNKHMLPIDCVNDLLGLIEENKKISFDEKYAEKIYREYNSRKIVDDSKDFQNIKKSINKKVLLLAPGKKLYEGLELVQSYHESAEYTVISLNMLIDEKTDFVITTRDDVYQELVKTDSRIIVTSNICKGSRGNVYVLDYGKWIIDDGKVRDSAFVIALKLLKKCGVKSLKLVGFDGFSVDINSNYYDPYLRHPLKEKQVKEYNTFYKELVNKYRMDGMEIEFITPSKYE